MLQGGHSAILSTFIKLPFVIKIYVLSIFEWPRKTGFNLFCNILVISLMARNVSSFYVFMKSVKIWYNGYNVFLLSILTYSKVNVKHMYIKIILWRATIF